MALHDLNDAWGWIQKLIRRVSRLESGAMLENSSITNGRMRFIGGTLRVDSGGSVEIVGTLQIDGTTTVTGTFTVTGPWELSGDGTITGNVTATGTWTQNGPWEFNGAGTIAGNVIISGTLNVTGNSAFGGTLAILGATTIDGDTTLNSDLTVGNGRVVVGGMVLDKLGPYNGRISSAAGIRLDAPVVYATGNLGVQGNMSAIDITAEGHVAAGSLYVDGAKTFRMRHPLKDDHWLLHGATESPISGTEYTGRVTLGDDGSAIVELPDYFEALNKPRNRTVHVTPVGRPFQVGADVVADGKVTVYGEPGRDVFWLVKAERFGGDFEVEQSIAA